jgi:hypothetical protein
VLGVVTGRTRRGGRIVERMDEEGGNKGGRSPSERVEEAERKQKTLEGFGERQ